MTARSQITGVKDRDPTCAKPTKSKQMSEPIHARTKSEKCALSVIQRL